MSNTNTLEPAIPRADSRQPLPRTHAIPGTSASSDFPVTQRDSHRRDGHPPDGRQPDQQRSDQQRSDQQRADQQDEHQQSAETWAYVDAAQNGDSDAFGRLYDQYAHIVYRYVFFRVSDHCLAEDITSETFLRALRRIASVSYQGRDVAAWFITIAKNLVLDHIKSSRNRLEVPSYELAHGAPTSSAQQHGPEHHVLAAATRFELLRCVRALNPDQRECIRLRFGQSLSVTETARLMQRNEGAIKALQHRAIRRLGQLLPDDPRGTGAAVDESRTRFGARGFHGRFSRTRRGRNSRVDDHGPKQPLSWDPVGPARGGRNPGDGVSDGWTPPLRNSGPRRGRLGEDETVRQHRRNPREARRCRYVTARYVRAQATVPIKALTRRGTIRARTQRRTTETRPSGTPSTAPSSPAGPRPKQPSPPSTSRASRRQPAPPRLRPT